MKNAIAMSLAAVALLIGNALQAQDFPGMDASPADIASYPGKYNISDKIVRIIYSRPQLKGRELAKLAPEGKVWRTGANEAAEITFYKDVTFGGKKVEAGTYAFFTIPGEDKWTVILNKDLNQWGAYSYDEDSDYLRVEANASKAEDSLEAFSIAFERSGKNAIMFLGWGTVQVQVPMEW